jgi:hypothetical protein
MTQRRVAWQDLRNVFPKLTTQINHTHKHTHTSTHTHTKSHKYTCGSRQ